MCVCPNSRIVRITFSRCIDWRNRQSESSGGGVAQEGTHDFVLLCSHQISATDLSVCVRSVRVRRPLSHECDRKRTTGSDNRKEAILRICKHVNPECHGVMYVANFFGAVPVCLRHHQLFSLSWTLNYQEMACFQPFARRTDYRQSLDLWFIIYMLYLRPIVTVRLTANWSALKFELLHANNYL